MAKLSAAGDGSGNVSFLSNVQAVGTLQCRTRARMRWMFLAVAIVLSPLVLAQNAPQVTGVDPASGKVNDTVTVSGQNLGKSSVSAVYLTDDKDDYKATVVEQSDDKIVVKVPQVKSGRYNISIQVGDRLLIKPVRFNVEG